MLHKQFIDGTGNDVLIAWVQIQHLEDTHYRLSMDQYYRLNY